MSIEERSYGNLTSAKFLGDSFERGSLLGLGGEECLRRLGQLDMLRYLLLLLVILKMAKTWVGPTYVERGKVGVRHVDGALNEGAREERGDDIARDSCILC